MEITVEDMSPLLFDDGAPVRAASAIAALGDGWLVVQDDATHAAWWRPGSITPLRVAPAVGGHEVFSSAAGTKHLKPDFEAVCPVTAGGEEALILLGSGSTGARMRASLVTPAGYRVASLEPLYDRVAATLGIPRSLLNLEGACPAGDSLRWFQRGNLAAGAPNASVDVDRAGLLAAITGDTDPARITVGNPRRYELGAVRGVALAVTDAVRLDDGRVLVSAAAEDTPNAVDDGPVIAAVLALLDGETVTATAELPASAAGPPKVEGLAVREVTADGVRLHAVVDADDPLTASQWLTLRVRW